jgi:hypothetical protein
MLLNQIGHRISHADHEHSGGGSIIRQTLDCVRHQPSRFHIGEPVKFIKYYQLSLGFSSWGRLPIQHRIRLIAEQAASWRDRRGRMARYREFGAGGARL